MIKAEDIELIIREALSKYDKGRREHGEQELLDCINYCVFQILRLRGIK